MPRSEPLEPAEKDNGSDNADPEDSPNQKEYFSFSSRGNLTQPVRGFRHLVRSATRATRGTRQVLPELNTT